MKKSSFRKEILYLVSLVLLLSCFTAHLKAESDDTIYGYGYFEYIIEDKGLNIVNYLGNEEEVYIPSSISGIPVYCISSGAFIKTSNIKTIYIPDTIVRIDENAIKSSADLVFDYNINDIVPYDEKNMDESQKEDINHEDSNKQKDSSIKDDAEMEEKQNEHDGRLNSSPINDAGYSPIGNQHQNEEPNDNEIDGEQTSFSEIGKLENNTNNDNSTTNDSVIQNNNTEEDNQNKNNEINSSSISNNTNNSNSVYWILFSVFFVVLFLVIYILKRIKKNK